ncbi:MAG: DsbC family protein [bacterium]|nr:DsbC family protein [Gammaproteobacteria bacterium]HIL96487.1 DsbC family protein [Pseudomonadales bacterium]
MRKTLIFVILLVIGLPGFAKPEKQSEEEIINTIRARLSTARPDLPIPDIFPSQLEGFYYVSLLGGQTLYISSDGKYLFAGDLYEILEVGLVNLTETGRSVQRKRLLDALDESEMLVFAPPKEMIKATVTVFTDIDCTYCRKLHREVPELNRLGIAVRYLAYPRAGTSSESYNKFVSAWCADNPKAALTKAKNNQPIEEKTCDNPVAAQYKLGSTMGVNSTPSLVYEDGSMDPGYMPAAKLAERLGIL